MKIQNIAFAFVMTYLWVLMIFLGAIFFETLIVYPDIFHDVPRSFQAAMAFMVVRGPSDFFPPVGMLSLITGLVSTILIWRVKSARYWIMASVLIILAGEFLFSMLFFWPRNTIMFEEGTAAGHSIDFLKQTAQEFQAAHWGRLVWSVISVMLAFTGFLKFYRYRIISSYKGEKGASL